MKKMRGGEKAEWLCCGVVVGAQWPDPGVEWSHCGWCVRARLGSLVAAPAVGVHRPDPVLTDDNDTDDSSDGWNNVGNGGNGGSNFETHAHTLPKELQFISCKVGGPRGLTACFCLARRSTRNPNGSLYSRTPSFQTGRVRMVVGHGMPGRAGRCSASACCACSLC